MCNYPLILYLWLDYYLSRELDRTPVVGDPYIIPLVTGERRLSTAVSVRYLLRAGLHGVRRSSIGKPFWLRGVRRWTPGTDGDRMRSY
jgi:hypothetical protein